MKANTVIYIILAVVAIVFIYNHFFFNPLITETVILDDLNELQKEVLSTLNEMTKLLISLSTALFALIGYFALENFKKQGRIEPKYRVDLVISFCSAAISIDFGYIFMEKLVELLSNGTFEPYDTLISLPRNLQLIFFLTALFFCARLIYRNLFKPNSVHESYA